MFIGEKIENIAKNTVGNAVNFAVLQKNTNKAYLASISELRNFTQNQAPQIVQHQQDAFAALEQLSKNIKSMI